MGGNEKRLYCTADNVRGGDILHSCTQHTYDAYDGGRCSMQEHVRTTVISKRIHRENNGTAVGRRSLQSRTKKNFSLDSV